MFALLGNVGKISRRAMKNYQVRLFFASTILSTTESLIWSSFVSLVLFTGSNIFCFEQLFKVSITKEFEDSVDKPDDSATLDFVKASEIGVCGTHETLSFKNVDTF